jgi:hypothetical protein
MSEQQPKKSILKNKWFWVGVVVVVLVIGRLGGGNKDVADGTTSASVPAEKPKVEVVVSAATYYEDYDGNEVAADAKYKGKRIEISGVVKDVQKDVLGNMICNLEVGTILSVACQLNDAETAASISPRTKVTLIGIGAGKSIFPRLEDCVMK